MECPYCGKDSRVLDSRRSGEDIRRRRQCLDCGRRFTTYERVAPPEIRVTKRDGRTEDFSRDKLVRVVGRILRDRPVAPASGVNLVRGLEAELVDSAVTTIGSWQVAEKLLARLRELDAIAAQRFATNYLTEGGEIRTRVEEASPQLALPMAATQEDLPLAPPAPEASAVERDGEAPAAPARRSRKARGRGA